MRRLLILILILLGLFSIFFYFSLGTEPKIVGEEETPPTGTSLDSTIKNNPIYASYVYVKGAGYVLKDRRIVLLIGQDTLPERQAGAIKNVEDELESYWKWQILSGSKRIEDLLNPSPRDAEKITPKNFFNRISDVFKVADAINVVKDSNKTCECDKNLLLLAGRGLHLIETTLNPGGGAEGGRSPGKGDSPDGGSHFKQATSEPQQGYGKTPQYSSFLVGIIDTGVNAEVDGIGSMNHPLNYNFLDTTSNISDLNKINHGTKIARIIVMNAGKKGYSIVGLKTFDINNIGNLYDNLCAILYATKNKMRVVNASWGAFSNDPVPVFEEVLRRAKAADVVVVCSAGNKHEDIDLKPYYPACYADHPDFGSHIITVTSKGDTLCQNFSTSGKKIDLTVRANELCNHGIPNASLTDSAATMENGTSYAAPYVTAGVIKYLIRNPSGFSKSGYISSIPSAGRIKTY